MILTGMGCSFDEWYNITESLSETNRVVMFHRPGLGESEIENEARNTGDIVQEMLDLMSVLEMTDPFILVGHSYGGLCAQHFAKSYPQKVAGLILVDSSSVDLQELDELDLPLLDEADTDDVWLEKCKTFSRMNPEQLRPIVNPTLAVQLKSIPEEVQKRLLEFQISPSLYKAMHLEISNWKEDAKIIKTIEIRLNVPLIVLGRDREFSIEMGTRDGLPEEELRIFEEKWQELITRQGNLSINSKIVFVQSASHSIHIDRPDVIIQSIAEIIKKIT